jgi:hypothetical protein
MASNEHAVTLRKSHDGIGIGKIVGVLGWVNVGKFETVFSHADIKLAT